MGDNENDSYSESSTQSWGSRLMDSIKGVATGFILFLISFAVLWWNEGRSVHTYKSLKEGKGATIEAKADSIDPAHENQLIHVTGRADTDETLTDEVFQVTARKALSLKRSVEMYQWKESCKSESEKNLGGSKTTRTTCTYEKGWAGAIDSSRFKKPEGHRNPAMVYASGSVVAQHAKLGAYKLPADLASRVGNTKSLDGQDDVLRRVKATTGRPASVTSGGIYVGSNSASPAVGDYRIRFEAAEASDASVIAVQRDGSFAAYTAKAGDQIYMISSGIRTAQEMYKAAEEANATLTWILRFVGWLVMAIGLYMLFAPFATLLDVLPFLGSFMSFGISVVAGITSFALSLITIAIAWMFYRPLLSLILIGVVVGVVFFLKQRAAQKKAATASA